MNHLKEKISLNHVHSEINYTYESLTLKELELNTLKDDCPAILCYLKDYLGKVEKNCKTSLRIELTHTHTQTHTHMHIYIYIYIYNN